MSPADHPPPGRNPGPKSNILVNNKDTLAAVQTVFGICANLAILVSTVVVSGYGLACFRYGEPEARAWVFGNWRELATGVGAAFGGLCAVGVLAVPPSRRAVVRVATSRATLAFLALGVLTVGGGWAWMNRPADLFGSGAGAGAVPAADAKEDPNRLPTTPEPVEAPASLPARPVVSTSFRLPPPPARPPLPEVVETSFGGVFRRVADRPGHPLPAGLSPYHYAATPITQAQFRAVVAAAGVAAGAFQPAFFGPGGGGQAEAAGLDAADHPMTGLSFADWGRFLDLLNRLPAESAAGRSYRPPTAAEFAAARAGLPTPAERTARLNFAGFGHPPTYTMTGQVDEFAPYNGLFGLAGNVREWATWDGCEAGYVVALGGGFDTPSAKCHLQLPEKPKPISFKTDARAASAAIGCRLVCTAAGR